MNRMVMAVDDSPTIRSMVKATLTKHGYEVAEACDGVEALEVSQNIDPILIITDVNMPNMDGLELVRQLRDKEKYKFIPILVLTTESSQEKKQEGRAAGATGWIVKPFDPEKLIEVVGKVCS